MTDHNAVEILLVEDNPHDAELAIRALDKKGLANRLHHIDDGAEALDFVLSQGAYADRRPESRPRVVLLDLKLPKVDGIEILRAIRSNPATRRWPVVMMTSSREERDIVDAYELGVNSYIVKPVDFSKFVDSVSQLGFYWLLLNEPPQ